MEPIFKLVYFIGFISLSQKPSEIPNLTEQEFLEYVEIALADKRNTSVGFSIRFPDTNESKVHFVTYRAYGTRRTPKGRVEAAKRFYYGMIRQIRIRIPELCRVRIN